jgi:hypothetical protein
MTAAMNISIIEECKATITNTFPWQLHLLLDDAELKGFSDVVSWLEGGTMFKVHKTKEFADHIMPCYFNQTRYKSFQRQLNSYRFHRFSAGKNKGTCFHELFTRERPDHCTHMNRVKVNRGRADAAQQQSSMPLSDLASSPNAPQLPKRESWEVDVPDNFLRMFDSTEVDPLDCPSVTMFDEDEEDEDIKLGRTPIKRVLDNPSPDFTHSITWLASAATISF